SKARRAIVQSTPADALRSRAMQFPRAYARWPGRSVLRQTQEIPNRGACRRGHLHNAAPPALRWLPKAYAAELPATRAMAFQRARLHPVPPARRKRSVESTSPRLCGRRTLCNFVPSSAEAARCRTDPRKMENGTCLKSDRGAPRSNSRYTELVSMTGGCDEAIRPDCP